MATPSQKARFTIDRYGEGMIPRTLFAAEHQLFRETVRKFIANEILPDYAQWEADGIVPRSVWLAAGEIGLLCPMVPEEYGGPVATLSTAP